MVGISIAATEVSSKVTANEGPIRYAWMLLSIEILTKWTPVFSIVTGIIGNIMSLLVTTKKDNRQISTCVYMAGLAVVDSCVLVVNAIHLVVLAHGVAEDMGADLYFLSFIWYGTDVFALISGLFLGAMSIDRAIAVVYPMKAATLCTASRARKVVVTTILVALIVHSQAFFIYQLPDPPNATVLVDFPQARWYETFFNIYLVIFGTVGPFTILIISNTAIIIGVRRAATERQKIESKAARKNKDANLTTMLLMTSFAYLVCSSPKRIYQTAVTGMYDLTDPYWSARYWFQWWICTDIWRLNFAVNFYIYFLGGGRKFRNDAKEVVMRLCNGCCAEEVL